MFCGLFASILITTLPDGRAPIGSGKRNNRIPPADFLAIKGEGGKIRDVPINETIRMEFTKFLGRTQPGHKLFVPVGKQTHTAMTELQNFIGAHRRAVQEDAAKNPLTFHGLRHTCAAGWYNVLIANGKNAVEARVQVSKLLGHERDDATRIYLASMDKVE